MRARLGLALFVAFLPIAYVGRPAKERMSAPPPAQNTSTLDDQTDLALTVYNADLALVRDVRNVNLPEGSFDLQFMDIAATVNPASAR